MGMPVTLKWARGKTQCNETQEVGHFCKSAVSHSWSHFYETGKIILTYGHPTLFKLFAHPSCILATQKSDWYLYRTAQMKMSPLISFLYIMPAKHSSVYARSAVSNSSSAAHSVVTHSAVCHVFCISFTHLLQIQWFNIHYVVEPLCYKPEGRGFVSRWGGFFQLT
jgi:hypothetical protein